MNINRICQPTAYIIFLKMILGLFSNLVKKQPQKLSCNRKLHLQNNAFAITF